MTAEQIRGLEPELNRYLGEFSDCFGDFDTGSHLRHYVRGQLSNLPRKSVEPIAHFTNVPPRTLQEFLSLSKWDHDRLRDRVQELVARDHADDQAIGIIDESGHPKKGTKTACVQRQYCGSVGKVDNCVMSVHLAYASFDARFRCILDSDLYLPKEGWNDPKRRKEAAIPDSATYRPKHEMALEQLRHALDNGVKFGWIGADEWYGEKPAFLQGLEALGRRFVLEIPKNLMGWVREPKDADVARGEVRDLARWSKPMVRQEWAGFHIKDTGNGAMVWEARSAPFWMKRDGRIVGPYWLIVTRDRLNQDTIKYFLSNAQAGVPLEAILHVAFSRWPVERCFEDEKSELGLSHFEVRKYPGVLRHLRLTQVSHLFLARQTRRLREKKFRGDDLPGSRRGQRDDRRLGAGPSGPGSPTGKGGLGDSANASRQRGVEAIARESEKTPLEQDRNSDRQTALLHPAARRVAL